ncbi:M16 family metallopeptidase [Actinomycetospora cinnamomea]|uniref:Putative Zn-dependent peptidase n=1 Tax=Actinomycetospora cinnamomea TaxID=663609 RepID=A0A2U1F8N4_9PSEU|nr:insulinase family protein [Actinomycetospora cinnamomea]PVZ08499.1 putative Zn-dependent peptidase [Actinomycetospora cinnamomea]
MTSTSTRRGADEIGSTPAGPRPLPPLGPQRSVPAPEEVDTVLDSGLRVIAVRRAEVPMVELRLRVPFADTSGREESDHAAVAEVLATTILSGTASRGRVAVDDELAGVGGELGFSVDPERLTVSGHALADGTDTLLAVLADLLLSATHPDDELARERARLVERIELAFAQPSVIARRALQERRYGAHPVTREMPRPEEVTRVTADAVRALQASALQPGGSVLVLVGDLDPADAVSRVERALAGWTGGRAAELPALPALTARDLLLVDRPGAVQSQLRLSAPAVGRTDPRYAALQLANLALGGYFSSRLVENLREDKGYTYHASSSLELDPHGAVLVVETDVASEVTAPALLETRYELGRLAVVPPTADEVESARRYLVGSLLISMTTQAGYASTVAALAAHGLSSSWVREHPARIEAVTADEVAAAAAEFFAPTAFTGVVVADAARAGYGLRALGGVETP